MHKTRLRFYRILLFQYEIVYVGIRYTRKTSLCMNEIFNIQVYEKIIEQTEINRQFTHLMNSGHFLCR